MGEFFSDWSNRERRAAAEVMRSRRCVISVIKHISSYDGKLGELDDRLVKDLDKCYHVAVEHNTHTKDVLFRNSAEDVETGLCLGFS
ncbi:hypothetical protein ANCDUO_07478 [Ancylostoma duodenale]|uniref:Uncharacterized protein n=1 Tax=Ancylostoma duodenale TaxID=51022 RepID=A0A0C2GYN7_9BILA|nr:hypothetical protein ANCDUO_07478 [Ancylostoma duodenale]